MNALVCRGNLEANSSYSTWHNVIFICQGRLGNNMSLLYRYRGMTMHNISITMILPFAHIVANSFEERFLGFPFLLHLEYQIPSVGDPIAL